MPRKTKARTPSPEPESGSSSQEDETLQQPPSDINPYEVLTLEKNATSEQVKSAYRKAALKHHPDKAASNDKDEAHKKFQEIALAYAILSDERRRKRYDTTGSTAETLDGDEDFDWVDFFREQTAAMVDAEMIEKVKREYQGSEEEKDDILRSYEENEGDMDAVYEQIMCSNVLDDDERFRKIIDEAVKAGQVESYTRYSKETKATKKRRAQKAKAEEAEAMELAEELGVKDKIFGGGMKKGKKTKENSEDALRALIQQRQKGRAETFMDNLEAKYGGGGKQNKRMMDEPPEEMFQKNAKKPRSKAR